VRELIGKNIRGELTEPEAITRFSFRDKGFVLAIAKTLKEHNVVHNSDVKAIESVLMPVLMCSIAGLGDLDTLQVRCCLLPSHRVVDITDLSSISIGTHCVCVCVCVCVLCSKSFNSVAWVSIVPTMMDEPRCILLLLKVD
jgi:hypothetical protein